MRKVICFIAILSLLLSMSFSLLSCTGTDTEPELYGEDNQPDENGKINYTITVKTEGGMPLKRVNVAIYDTKEDAYKIFTSTDSNGTATVKLKPSADYVAQIYDAPDGYVVLDSYSFNLAIANIRLQSKPIDGNPDASISYSLGSVMHDFNLQTTDGNTLKLSELLEEYECILLNFWFINCPFCIEEFPDLDKVSKEYGDDAKVIAVNPIDSPSATKAYKDTSSLSFDMVSDSSIARAFGFDGYPVTVVVDRYGVICYVQPRALNEDYFRIILDAFVGDDYTQKLYTSFSDFLPKQ